MRCTKILEYLVKNPIGKLLKIQNSGVRLMFAIITQKSACHFLCPKASTMPIRTHI